jgi:Mn2+/Fe2+ NRAMP family transporter
MPHLEHKVRDPPRGWLGVVAAIGPGIVVTGSVIGSGELINTPVQAAKFGFVLLWAVLLSCVIKYFLQVEFGRHALVHQRTPFEAFNTLPYFKWGGTSWIGIAYIAGSVLTAASLVGILSSCAGMLHGMVPLASGSPTRSVSIWAGILAVLAAALLWRGAYADVEKLISLLVAGFSVSIVVALLLLQMSPYRVSAGAVASGLQFSLGEIDPAAAAVAVISLLGALGTTANEMFMYPYWILEKGYGAYVGASQSPGWLQRARGWIRVLQWDAGICTALATVTTVGYFLMGAAVFHGRGPVPGGNAIVDRLSAMFTESFGPWSKGLFLFGAFCTLYSTLIVGVAAFSRMWCDMFISLGWLVKENRYARMRALRGMQMVYLAGCLLVAVFYGREPAKLVIFGQYISGLICTPLLMVTICWLAFRTDSRVRMSKPTAVLLLISVAVIVACLAISLGLQSGVLKK